MTINLRQLLLDRAARGIGTGGGLLNNKATGGLLGNLNPLFLGASIIGSGMQGRDPFSSVLPAATQAAQLQQLLTPEEKEIGERASFGMIDVLIPSNSNPMFSYAEGFLKNYFPDDDPEKDPIVTWKSHGNLLFNNWLNYHVYQLTPYDPNLISADLPISRNNLTA